MADALLESIQKRVNADIPTENFGEGDAGLVRFVMFGTAYDISPCREMTWIQDRIRTNIAAQGKDPEDASLWTQKVCSDAAADWVETFTKRRPSYEMAIAVYTKMDGYAADRLRFFLDGPSSPTVSESARGPFPSESEMTSSTPSSDGPETEIVT